MIQRNLYNTKDAIRAVAPVVGFLLVVAIVFLAAAQYQADVVPREERESESNHFQEVNDDMSSLRARIIQAAGNGQLQSQSINTGLEYSVLGLTQPPVPGIFVHQTQDEEIQLENVENNQEAENFWTGNRNETYETGFISYRVDYNRFANAGELYIEHGFLYQDAQPGVDPRNASSDPNIPLRIIPESNQPIVNNKTITLYMLQDGYSTNNLAASGVSETTVELEPVSPRSGGEMKSITVTDADSGPITITLPTRLPVSEWQNILEDELVSNGGYIDSISTASGDAIEIEMQQDEVYNLRMSKVNVQTTNQRTPIDAPEAQYVAVEDQPASVQESSTVILRAEARDKYNNGVIGQRVEAEARTADDNQCIGDFEQVGDNPQCGSTQFGSDNQPGVDIADEEGRISYRYQSPEVARDQSISFIYRLED